MTAERGWYPDPSDAHTMRFWTGTQWIGERVWDGSTWIDRIDPASVPSTEPVPPPRPPVAAPPVTTPPIPPSPPVAAPSMAATARALIPARLTMSHTAMFLFVGCAVAAVGTMLPWEQDTTAFGGQVSAGPSSVPGGVAILLALLGAVVWIAWPTRDGAISKRRRVALTVVAGLVAFFAIAKFSALGNAASQSATSGSDAASDLFGSSSLKVGLEYHAGSGLFIYSAGAISICVGVVRAWFARRTRPEIAGDHS